MQPILDRIPVCRCFHEDVSTSAKSVPHRAADPTEPARWESEARLPLRPDVPCLQRWLDLNA
jgi:hypothetical protein